MHFLCAHYGLYGNAPVGCVGTSSELSTAESPLLLAASSAAAAPPPTVEAAATAAVDPEPADTVVKLTYGCVYN